MLIILAAIVVLGMLTAMVSNSSNQETDTVARQTMDDEVSRTMGQASALGGALSQMLVNGENPATLYTDLSLLKPGDAGFETAPHNLKIFHPMGGGILYMPSSTAGTAPLATAFNIVPDAIVTGIGPTDAVIGDILFVARISSAAGCARFNKAVTGSEAIPVMETELFEKIFLNGIGAAIDTACVPTCANIPRICVSNTEENAWGYYSVLLPG